MVKPVEGKDPHTTIIIDVPKAQSKKVNNLPNPLHSSRESINLQLNQIEATHCQEEHELEGIIESTENLENLAEFVENSIERDVPSFSDVVNQWGNEEIALLYHQYVVITKAADSVWSGTSVIDVGVAFQSNYIRTPLKVAGMYPSKYQLSASKLERDLSAIALAYKVPCKLGKIGVLIYKLIFLSHIEKALKSDLTGMSDEQRNEFNDWLAAEKKEISDAAKISIIRFGASAPGYLYTLIRVCQINAPLLRLGLTWINCTLDPAMECYELYQAFKDLKNVKEDIAEFRDENFRSPGQVQEVDLEEIMDNLSSKDTENPLDLIQTTLQKDINERAEIIRNRRKESLLGKRDDFEEDFNRMLNALTHPSGIDRLQELGKPFVQISKEITDLHKLAERTQGQSFLKTLEKAFLLENIDDIKFYLADKGLNVDDEITTKEELKNAVSIQFRDAVDGALASLSIPGKMTLIKKFFEERGLAIDPDIETAEEFFSSLEDENAKDNLLARYIDVNSKQDMLDTTRNALKTLVMKKQLIDKKEVLWGLKKSTAFTAAVVLSSILTVTLVTIAAAGVIVIPSIVFLIPAFGMIGLSTVLLVVGLMRFYKNSPNLFMEYAKGSFIELAVYNIPKGIHDLRMSITILKIGLKARSRGKLLHKIEQNNSEKLQEKLKKLNKEDEALKNRLDDIQKKLNYWNAKIKPIASGIALAKWKDFLQERPKRMKEQGSAGEIIAAMKTALLEGSIDFDDDVKKILQERFGIDINDLKDSKVADALWAFAP